MRSRCSSLLLLLAQVVASDVIFRVPEVLVRHAAAPRPVGTTKTNATSNESGSQPWDELDLRYEEYFVEHEVSTGEARAAAQKLDPNDLGWRTIGCGACTKKDLEYCESRVLADHCCCERRYFPEPFPWLPHTCYAGPKVCKALAGDCARYTRLRDCCCYAKLSARWKSILSSGSRPNAATILLLAAAIMNYLR